VVSNLDTSSIKTRVINRQGRVINSLDHVHHVPKCPSQKHNLPLYSCPSCPSCPSFLFSLIIERKEREKKEEKEKNKEYKRITIGFCNGHEGHFP
jgi:hypothetical protein